jgi:FkbM family methyltransferase
LQRDARPRMLPLTDEDSFHCATVSLSAKHRFTEPDLSTGRWVVDQLMDMRITLSHLLIENERLLSALKRIPGFRFCAKRIGARVVPIGHREWFQVQDGVGKDIWLKLDPRSGGQYYRGQAEADLQGILRDYLRPGMVLYDLGSNNGFFSLIAARIVGPTGRVVAFEAEPSLWMDIVENIERNDAQNVLLIRSAVWSNSGFVDFKPVDRLISPGAGLGRVVSNSTTGTISVPSVCLDDFAQKERPPDLIKCDVEGAEVDVFRGARKVLAEHRPYVECEIHSDENGKLLYAAFDEMNYDVRWYSTNHFFAVPRNLPFRTAMK